jgi:hypothetical protein
VDVGGGCGGGGGGGIGVGGGGGGGRGGAAEAGPGQGLELAHFRAQLEDLRDTSLTLELNLSTLGPHARVDMGNMGDKVSSS